MRLIQVLCVGLCAMLLFSASPLKAETLSTPTERVVLLVDGNITEMNLGNAAIFDMPMLKALGSETFTSKTEWTEGEPTFIGVPLNKLIEKVGAAGDEIIATAADGYAISVPMADLKRYSVLLVHSINGDDLDPNDKGPLWIMYRWDQMSPKEIKDKSPNAVWQLQQLTFE